MGIVVTIGMLIALIGLHRTRPAPLWVIAVVLTLGLWNAGWYGVRHWDEFWGVAAIVSGSLMIAAAVLLRRATAIRSLRMTISVGLVASFLLYAVTIIRLNLGLSIPG